MNLTCKNGKTISNSKPKCKVYFINLKYKAKQGKVNALSASCLSLLHRFSLLFVLRSMLLSAPGFALRLASRFSFRFALRRSPFQSCPSSQAFRRPYRRFGGNTNTRRQAHQNPSSRFRDCPGTLRGLTLPSYLRRR